jgi:hypothetical protein
VWLQQVWVCVVARCSPHSLLLGASPSPPPPFTYTHSFLRPAAGASALLWLTWMPSTLLTMLEFDAECAANFREGLPFKPTALAKLPDAARGKTLVHPLSPALRERLVHVFAGDQSSPEDLAQVTEDGPFDVIVDDGGHSMLQQIVSLRELMPLVKPGGVYVLEDLLTTYFWMDGPWHDEAKTGGITTMQYIYALVDALHWPDTLKTLPPAFAGIRELSQIVRSVECFREVCVFTRR